jgi:Transposase DDE domain group 1
LFSQWVKECPLEYRSPNAPEKQDVLGTITLSILAGHCRYAHIAALRGDQINREGFGMKQICSEDSVRAAFEGVDPERCAQWQQRALARCWEPVLQHPWILDIDVSVKPIYGHQEGAELGYNPHKPGRPSHTLHSLFLRRLRLVLEVAVHGGKQHAAKYSVPHLWELWERLGPEQRPWLVCGDAGYGQEQLMQECEARGQKYLFRQRKTPKVKELIELLSGPAGSGWQATLLGWEAAEGSLQLSGWSRQRRVVVLRRRRRIEVEEPTPPRLPASTLPSLPWKEELVSRLPDYEVMVLVTNLSLDRMSLVDLYRQRADSENAYDELKNQWGWGGFMTRDLHRCQVAARNIALIYNWWSLFVRCADPQRPREAITSRPLMMAGIGRMVESAHQLKVYLSSVHEAGRLAQRLLTGLSQFLNGLKNTAEQLSPAQCWQRIWDRILGPLLKPAAALPGPSG